MNFVDRFSNASPKIEIENFEIFWKIDSGTKKFGDHKGLQIDESFVVPEEVVYDYSKVNSEPVRPAPSETADPEPTTQKPLLEP